MVLIPEEQSWETLIESTRNFTADFMADRNQPPMQERETLGQ